MLKVISLATLTELVEYFENVEFGDLIIIIAVKDVECYLKHQVTILQKCLDLVLKVWEVEDWPVKI